MEVEKPPGCGGVGRGNRLECLWRGTNGQLLWVMVSVVHELFDGVFCFCDDVYWVEGLNG